MPFCHDCLFYHPTETTLKGECNYLHEIVDEYGRCDNFSARPTKSNSNYSSGSGCFLTSACVDYLGKPDDCKELTMLRKYRDEQMKKMPDGEQLVKEYYEIAPKIVKAIESSPDKSKYYDKIYSVVSTCVTLIEEENYDEVLKQYKNMVLDLKKEFGL